MCPHQDDLVEPAADPMPRLRQSLHAFLRSKVRDAALVDDMVQETLLRVETRMHTLRSRDRLESWVFQIARNTLADHFRKTKETEAFDETAHGPLLVAADASPSTEDEALSQELRHYVRSVVERLPPLYREAVRCIELEGLSQVELARRLGLSISATKSRVQRGRALLRKEMERCCHWETDRYGTVLSVEPRGNCRCQETAAESSEK